MNAKLGAGSIIGCAAALVSLQLLAPAAAQAQSAPWTVVPSADNGTGSNSLAAVASVAAGDVWAVGNFQTATGEAQALTEHWDGSAWSLVPSPTPVESSLNGVAAASTSDVWATGSFLNSASVEQALFEHWNGRKWVQAKSPATGPVTVMNGVAAVSPTDIWAVGQSQTATGGAQTLIENFNGHKWAVVPSPDATAQNNILTGVTAVSASDIWAVGRFEDASSNFHTLTEHWDGTAWSIVASPDGPGFESELNSATALSGSDVWAVGDSAGSGTLTERWNGTSWSVVASPTVATNSSLTGVAAVTASDIWAVGDTFTTSGVFQAFIEQWNGTSWSIVPSPNPGTANFLAGAAADPSSGQARAVGNFIPTQFTPTQTLTEFNH